MKYVPAEEVMEQWRQAPPTIRSFRHLPLVRPLMEANLRDKKMSVPHVNFACWLVDHGRIGEQV